LRAAIFEELRSFLGAKKMEETKMEETMRKKSFVGFLVKRHETGGALMQGNAVVPKVLPGEIDGNSRNLDSSDGEWTIFDR
jgi:hypothetical protein